MVARWRPSRTGRRAIRNALRDAGCVEFGERDGGFVVESPDTADDPSPSAVLAIRLSTVLPRSKRRRVQPELEGDHTVTDRYIEPASTRYTGGSSEGNRRDGSGRRSSRDHTRGAA